MTGKAPKYGVFLNHFRFRRRVSLKQTVRAIQSLMYMRETYK